MEAKRGNEKLDENSKRYKVNRKRGGRKKRGILCFDLSDFYFIFCNSASRTYVYPNLKMPLAG